MSTFTAWTSDDAREYIAVPSMADDKYSRGVLGVITGSAKYPGAAVLGVEAALHTGVGMLRYLGAERPADFVLRRRPEVVSADGRVQAWLLGSGIDATDRDDETGAALYRALSQGLPSVLDAGALDLIGRSAGQVLITPHFSELAGVVGVSTEQIAANPAAWSVRAAEELGVTVLLKGHNTYVASPDGTRIVVTGAPSWLATAGAGDALGGIVGALLATHSAEISRDAMNSNGGGMLARLAASAAVIHGLAAERASAGGPFTILELTENISPAIAQLLRR